MRRIVFVMLLAVPFAGAPALADDDVGCGFGTQLWEGSSGLGPKVLAATTNGIFGNQTFGISSGTLGCEQTGVITAEHRVNMFVGDNIDQLAREMAVGDGEALASLAALLEVAPSERAAFYTMTQRHFGELFPSTEQTAGKMLETLDRLMASELRG